MQKSFPKIYPILDVGIIPDLNRAVFLNRLGRSLTDAGVELLEYRNKTGTDAELLADGEVLRAALPVGKVKLILDDRADLVDSLGFDGVHVDDGDVSPFEARRVVGPDRIVGTFGGSDQLLEGLLNQPADYFAIGPVYPTSTKRTEKPPIGSTGVAKLRAEAGPDAILVAAAGITYDVAELVLASGANTVAVAAAIFKAADPAAEFDRWMRRFGS